MLKEVKKNIIQEENTLYLDYTASGQGYKEIENKLLEVLKTYANTHSKTASNSVQTSKYYEQAREDIRECLNIDNSFYILPCGSGASYAIKKFQELRGIYIPEATKLKFNLANIKDKPLVIIGPFEHHSNEISFRQAICDLIRIPLNEYGLINLHYLEKTLEENKNRNIIGSFSYASNVTGIFNPIEKIKKLIKKYGGIMCVDCASSSPHLNLACENFDVMFLSPHKLLGGVGSSGILVIKKNLCNLGQAPSFAGGGTFTYVSRTKHKFIPNFEEREDAGTPGILQFIKASYAYKLRNKIGLTLIKEIEEDLKEYFSKKILEIDNIKLYAKNIKDKLAIFSFNVGSLNPYKIAKILAYDFKIQTRAGCSCASPYGHDILNMQDDKNYLKKPSWLRVSLNYTHTKEDIDYFISSLKKSIKKLKH